MKISYVAGLFPKLSETFILNQITYLIDQGHDVNIISSRDPKEPLVHGDIEKYGLRNRTMYLRKNQFHPGFELSEEVIESLFLSDIIHAHFAAQPARIAMELSEVSGVPFIFTAHAYDIFINPDLKQLQQYAEHAAKILTISEFNREYLIKLLGNQYSDKIEIIRCSIDLDQFSPREKAVNKQFTILSCGRLIEKKGIDYAIRAIGHLHGEQPVELRIIGDGPLKDDLELLITKSGLSGQIKLLGAQAQETVFREMRDADIFLLPSVTAANGDREGIPVSLLEAQAVGLPVISTFHSGIPEGVVDGETGFLVPERDVEAIASKIDILSDDRDLRKKMGAKGRDFVIRHYDNRVELPKLERLMGDLVNKNQLVSMLNVDQQDELRKRVGLISNALRTQHQQIAADLLANANRETQFLHDEILAIQSNSTWKITKPLRKLIRIAKTLEIPRWKSPEKQEEIKHLRDRNSNKTEVQKVLYVLDNFPKLSETFILNEIVELICRGIGVQVIALKNPNEHTINRKVLTHNLLKKTRWVGVTSNKIFLKSRDIQARYGDFDIVHAHFAAPGAAAGLKIAEILGLPFTITAHAYEIFRKPKIRKLRILIGSATAIITPSEYNKSYIEETIGHLKENIHIVHATINASDFSITQAKCDKERTGKTIITVGRLVEKKGLVYLLEAMQKVLSHHPETVLYIVGSGPLEEALQRITRELFISESVQFLGDQTNEECARLISESDMAVLPCIIADDGDRDVCPLVLQEAMAMGLPVVSTRVASIPELVDDQVSGILVPERDANALSHAIVELIENKDLAAQMGLNAREKIENEFNIETQVEHLVNLWNGLLNIQRHWKNTVPTKDARKPHQVQRVIYLLPRFNISQTALLGVKKKILGQTRAFQLAGMDVEIIDTPDVLPEPYDWGEKRNGAQGRPLGLFQNLKRQVNNAVSILRRLRNAGNCILYVRHSGATMGSAFLHLVLRLMPNVKRIYLEIPTWPYQHETFANRSDPIFRPLIGPLIHKVVTFSSDPRILGVETIRITNGVSAKENPQNSVIVDDQGFKMVFVGQLHHWTGIDRILDGLSRYLADGFKGRKVCLQIAGDGHMIKQWIKRSAELGLTGVVEFHGNCFDQELEDIYFGAHMAFGNLGNHRRELPMNADLKNREYCMRGIPFVAASSDPAFPDAFRYRHLVSADDSSIDIEAAIQFYNSLSLDHPDFSSRMRAFALKNLCWETTMLPVIQDIKDNF